MARPTTLRPGLVAEVRSASAAIAAENASLTDANYPVAQAIDCSQYDTIFVGAEIVGGTSPTITIEALVRDGDASDGARWKRRQLGARPGVTAGSLGNENSGALGNNSDLVELRVYGAKQVFLRISAVANAASTTSWKILAMGGQVRPGARIIPE